MIRGGTERNGSCRHLSMLEVFAKDKEVKPRKRSSSRLDRPPSQPFSFFPLGDDDPRFHDNEQATRASHDFANGFGRRGDRRYELVQVKPFVP